MKENIPFDKFIQYLLEMDSPTFPKSHDDKIKQAKKENEKFAEMTKVTWEDFESCTKEEMEKIPLGWLYDWTHVTANYDKQDKVEELYSRYGLTPLYGKKYLSRFERNLENK